MPTYVAKLPDDIQQAILSNGDNPADFVFDGQYAIHKDTLPPLDLGGQVLEGGKGVVRGAINSLANVPEFIGTGADVIGAKTGPTFNLLSGKVESYDPNNPSVFTSLARGIHSFADYVAPTDVRANPIATATGEGIGALAGVLVPAGAGSKVLGALAPTLEKGFVSAVAKRAAMGNLGLGMANQNVEGELGRQAAEGRFEPGSAYIKAIPTTAAQMALAEYLGPGRLLKGMNAPATSVGDIIKRGVVNAVTGGAAGAGQEAVGQGIMEGKIDTDRLKTAAAVGALSQAIGGGVLDTITRDPNYKPPVGESPELATASLFKGGKAREQTESNLGPLSPEEISAMQMAAATGEKYNPLIKSPVHEVFNELVKRDVVPTEDQIQEMHRIWGGKEENIQKVKEYGNALYNQSHVENALDPHGKKAQKPADVVEEASRFAQEQREAQEKINKWKKNIAGQEELLNDPSLTTEQRLKLRAYLLGEVAKIQRAQQELVDRAATFGSGKIPAGLLTEGTGPGVRVGQGTGPEYQGPPRPPRAITVEPFNETPWRPVEPLQLPGRPDNIGTSPASKSLMQSPAVKSLRQYLTEGEQGGPFVEGSGETRSFGMPQKLVTDLREYVKKAYNELRPTVVDTRSIKIEDYPDAPLSDIQRKFAQVHNHQRWLGPESMFDESANPGVQYTTGFWRSMMEHGGDLVHRASYSGSRADFGGGGIEYGRGAVLEKAKKLLYWMQDAEGKLPITQDVQEQLSRNHACYVRENKLNLNSEEFDKLMSIVGSRYADAYADIKPVTEVQKLGRDVAIDIGRRNFRGAVPKLEKLIKLLEAKDWETTWFKPLPEEAPPEYQFGMPRRMAETLRKLLPDETTSNYVPFWFTRSVTDRLAQAGPAAAHMAAKVPEMIRERNAIIAAEKSDLAKFKPVLANKTFQDWMHWASDNNSDDTSGLPDNLRPWADAWIAFKQATQEVGRSHDIGVEAFDAAGNRKIRPAKAGPGWNPWGFSEDVKDTFAKARPEEQAAMKQAWVSRWAAAHGNTEAAFKNAEAAFEDIMPSGLERFGKGKTPEFGPIRMQQGIGLPREMRDLNDPTHGWNRYIDRQAGDVSYAKHLQQDPVIRRAAGIKEDTMGRAVNDPVYWDEVPEAWASAVRRGKEAHAVWAKDADPMRPPHLEIDSLQGKADLIRPLMMSYSHQNVDGITSQFLSAAQGMAGRVLMQAGTGLRDFFNVAQTLTYVPFKDLSTGIDALSKALAHPSIAIKQAEAKGALPVDVLADELPQTQNAIIDGMRKATAVMGHATGRTFSDRFAKAITFSVIREVVAKGGGKDLVKEFGPVDGQGNVADIVANRVTQIIHNPSDATNLPPALIPQMGTLAGHMLKLSNWAVASSNNYYKHVITPALRGDIGRLVRSLVLLGASGTATDELISWITGKKPQHLTWAEWMRLPTSEQQWHELAPTWLGYIANQAGITTDITKGAVKMLQGRANGAPELTIKSPLPIIAMNLAEKLASFNNATQAGYMSWTDLGDLGDLLVEFGKEAQMVKMLNGRLEEKNDTRDQRIFTELYGLDPKTGLPKAAGGGLKGPIVNDPFSFNNRAWSADSPEAFQKLLPYALDRTLAGNPISLKDWMKSPIYYSELARRLGPEEAAARYKTDAEHHAEKEMREALLLK